MRTETKTTETIIRKLNQERRKQRDGKNKTVKKKYMRECKERKKERGTDKEEIKNK